MNQTAVEEKIYVAVAKKLEESRSSLLWAIHSSGGRQIIILHVHQPEHKIPFMGTKFRKNKLEEQWVAEYHESKKQVMLQLLDEYKQTCRKYGVSADAIYTVKDSIEKGIVELIVENNVKRLVMGAAADKHYTKRMVDLRSRKAIYVRLQAPPTCHIHFVCKGNLITTRLDVSVSPITNSDSRHNSLMLRSVSEGQNIILELNSYHRVKSDNRGTRISTFPLPHFSVESTPVVEWNGSPSTCSSAISEGSEAESHNGYTRITQAPSPSSVIERSMNDELYHQLVQVMAEADNSKRDAFEEFSRCRKAEKHAIQARDRVKAFENSYAEELRRRREIDEALVKTKEEHENIKKEVDEVAEQICMALEQKSFLESQIGDCDHAAKDLDQKLFSAVDHLQIAKKERDELQAECDDALRLLEEMKASSSVHTEFSFSEIKDATHNFDPCLKIGEGGYGSIFRGFIRHTQVAIKMLHPRSLQGPTEYQQEINILSKLRHPNLVTLIGACPDAWIIVYEYLSGGSLEDRLNCKDNSPPLSWQNRIRIAAELCSVLIYLHSCGIVHGDLKPANLLLDDNLVTKLSDFGICRVLSPTEFSSNNTSLCCRTDPKGTFVYVDPEFCSTGELTSKSDTYSFGIILLNLLTGRPALKLVKDVQHALKEENLKSILDPTAGDWPFVHAQQLALLALKCCDVVRKNRPELASEAWRVLEPMRVSCGGTEIPQHFICPIFKEMMQDPVVGADGFTYEAEALRGWLDSGHKTSPMTNLELANSNFVPNHALRSAIQEWLQQS